MNKKMRTVLRMLFLLTLVTLVGMTIPSVTASLQIVTIDIVPDNAGSVEVYKNYPDVFMGFVTTKKNFDFDTKDSIAIVPASFDKGSKYKFTKMCDDVECVTGVYIGKLNPNKLTYTMTVYYEIPSDKESPSINGIVLSTITPNVGDKIDIVIEATDNTAVTKVTAKQDYIDPISLNKISENKWSGQITATKGTNNLFIVAYDAIGNYATDNSQSYTSTQISTSTPTTSTLHIVNLKLSSDVDVITATVMTTGSGKLGIDLDTKALVFTKDIVKDGETKAELKVSLGEHIVCARNVDNVKEIKCESVEIKPSSTPKPNPTSTPTPAPTETQTKLKTETDSTTITDTYGRINIDSTPNVADVFLNNVHYGSTPYSADIETGSYTLRITKDDYKDFTKMVIIKESTPTDVIVTLVSINGTSNTENNQSNQTTMSNNENSKQQNNVDSNTLLINNLIILATIVFIGAVAIICTILYTQRQKVYILPPENNKSTDMIVVKKYNSR